MAADTGEVEEVVVRLSHRRQRALLRKEKRRTKRQELARQRNDGEEAQEEEVDDVRKAQEEREERRIEAERMRAHLEWQKRERQAQEEFQQLQARAEEERRRREEEERRIKEEWENQQTKEKEEKERKEVERRAREEAIHKLLEDSDKQTKGRGAGEDWRNPDAPRDYGTERDRAHCPFFLKTGACRFGDRCSRQHLRPSRSATLLLRAMFAPFGLEQTRRDDYDSDAGLELADDDLRRQFRDFYRDVLPEMRRSGRVRQFKVSCNFEPHLRGNVYVQYETEEEATQAFQMFNGRWYAGRQVNCEFCPVSRWKSAICGLYDRQRCPKGKSCNFLHVFQNPGNEFWEADRDLDQRSPESRTGGGRRERSPRSDRHDRQRRQHRHHRSRSAERDSSAAAAAAAAASSSSSQRRSQRLPSDERTPRREHARSRWSERRSEREVERRRGRSRSRDRSERSEKSPSGSSRRRSPGTRWDSSARRRDDRRDGRRSGSRESSKDDKMKRKDKKAKKTKTKEEEEGEEAERRERSKRRRGSEGRGEVDEAQIGTQTTAPPQASAETRAGDGPVAGDGTPPATNGRGGSGDRGNGNHGDEQRVEEAPAEVAPAEEAPAEEAPLCPNGSDGASERLDAEVNAISPRGALERERSQVTEKAWQEEDVSREVEDTVQWILES